MTSVIITCSQKCVIHLLQGRLYHLLWMELLQFWSFNFNHVAVFHAGLSQKYHISNNIIYSTNYILYFKYFICYIFINNKYCNIHDEFLRNMDINGCILCNSLVLIDGIVIFRLYRIFTNTAFPLSSSFKIFL